MPKPRILVVEDEQDVAKVISINLELEDMEVTEAHDGPAALELIGSNAYDCVVLDVMLPRVSGWDILKSIKGNPETAGTPVVMVTAKVRERDQLRGLGAGAVKYITKPFSPVALTDAIKSVLKPQVRDEVARERRETIERLQLSTLHRISDILISAPVPDELFAGIAEKLCGLFDFPHCALVLSGDNRSDVYTFKRASSRGKSTGRGSAGPEVEEALLQAFAANRRPVKASDLAGFSLDAIFAETPSAEDGYVLPLYERDAYLGAIVIAGSSGVNLSMDEEDLLATIANQVASAVARARLHESLREDETIHRRLLHQAITVQESERRRLAAEIHDSIVQSLVGVSYRLQALDKKMAAADDDGLAGDIKAVEEQLDNSIRDLRDLLLGLRPPMLDDMGLGKALEAHLKNFAARSRIQYSLQLPESMPALTRDARINLFRIVQEALNNVEKHAGARHVTIEVRTTTRKLHLAVRDDGKGYSRARARRKTRNLGIASMKERTELLGGSFEVKSEPGRGTLVALDVPLRQIVEG